MQIKEAKEWIDAVVEARKILTDEQALRVPALYPKWTSSKEYTKGDRVLHKGALYKAMQDKIAGIAIEPGVETDTNWKKLMKEDDHGQH